MARLFIGRKTSGGGGLVRVMKNNTDDPNTTPSSQVNKFLFDSEVNDLGYAVKTYTVPPGIAIGYYPAGTNIYTCDFARLNGSLSGIYWFRPQNWLASPYPQYVDMHVRNPSTGWYSLYYRYGDFVTRSDAGYSYGEMGYGCYGQLRVGPYYEYFDGWKTITGSIMFEWPSNNNNRLEFNGAKYNVWTIPFDETNFAPPSATPVAGQRNVRIDPNAVKIARPGFDVSTATGRQLIADSDRIPAKLLRAGSIASISSGGFVDVPVGFTVPVDTFVDAQFSDRDFAAFTLPGGKAGGAPYKDAFLNVEYEIINGNTVRFHNLSDYGIKGRYMIFGCNDGQTTGTGPVLQTIPETNPQYCRIVRPGASANPHWDDIILDTRVSYLPLVATGWIPKAQFGTSDNGRYGDLLKSITFSIPTGYVPYVKPIWKESFVDNDGNTVPTYTGPFLNYFWSGAASWNYRGDKTRVVEIVGNTVKFYASTQGVSDWSASGPEVDGTGFTGLIYHVFAVPDTL